MHPIYLSLLFVTVIGLHSASATSIDVVNGKIRLTIGTTAGCSDTVTFITQGLAEAYEQFRDILEITFVPWGRTARDASDGSLTCYFGPADCWANRVHRCALNLLEGNQDAQVHYMTCEFSPPYPAVNQRSYLCAQVVGIRLIDLDYCVNTSGSALDAAAELAAREPMAVINFVPSIHFNDVPDRPTHDQARTRLSSMICFALAELPDSGFTQCQI